MKNSQDFYWEEILILSIVSVVFLGIGYQFWDKVATISGLVVSIIFIIIGIILLIAVIYTVLPSLKKENNIYRIPKGIF